MAQTKKSSPGKTNKPKVAPNLPPLEDSGGWQRFILKFPEEAEKLAQKEPQTQKILEQTYQALSQDTPTLTRLLAREPEKAELLARKHPALRKTINAIYQVWSQDTQNLARLLAQNPQEAELLARKHPALRKAIDTIKATAEGQPPSSPPQPEETPRKVYLKKTPLLRRETVRLSPLTKNLIDRAPISPEISSTKRVLGRRLARQVAYREIAKINPQSEAIPEQITQAFTRANLQPPPPQTIQDLVLEIKNPLSQIGKTPLPDKVKKKLKTKELSPEKGEHLPRFSATDQVLKEMIAADPEKYHPALRLMTSGIFAADIDQSLQSLKKAYTEAGYSEKQIEEDPLIQNYEQIKTQLQNFNQLHPRVTSTLQKTEEVARRLGVNVEKIDALKQKFSLPYLELQKPKAIELAKTPFRDLVAKTFTKYENYAALRNQVLIPAFKKVINRFAQSTAGKAVIAGAKSLTKATAKQTAKLAAKLGLEGTLTAIGAALPTGVTQVLAVIGVYDMALDLVEAIPVVGKPLAKIIDVSNPIGWARQGIKGLGKIATLPLEIFKKEEAPDLGKQIFNASLVAVPVIAVVAVIAGPAVAIGAVLTLAAGAVIISQAGRIASTGAVAAAGIGVATIAFFTRFTSPVKINLIKIALITFSLLIFLSIFIIVLLGGGAFMTHPINIAPPPSGTVVSEYFEVTKTASPLQVSNPTSEIRIHYQIIITGTQGALTNIQVSNETQIRKPTPSGQTFVYPIDVGFDQAQNGNEISILSWQLTGPGVIEYWVALNPDYIRNVTDFEQIHDSWLLDTVTVTADIVNGPAGEIAADSARVRIGNPLTLGPSTWPVSGRITQGPRIRNSNYSHYIYGNIPNSIDIGAVEGTTVYAAHDGVAHVFQYPAGHPNWGYGHYIQLCSISGCDEYYTLYGHLVEGDAGVFVREGDYVAACQPIGLVDNTGNSSGNHLHYELRRDPGLGTNILLYVSALDSPYQDQNPVDFLEDFLRPPYDVHVTACSNIPIPTPGLVTHSCSWNESLGLCEVESFCPLGWVPDLLCSDRFNEADCLHVSWGCHLDTFE